MVSLFWRDKDVFLLIKKIFRFRKISGLKEVIVICVFGFLGRFCEFLELGNDVVLFFFFFSVFGKVMVGM